MLTLIRESTPALDEFVVSEVKGYIDEYERISLGSVKVVLSIDKLVTRSKFNLDVVPFIQSRNQAAMNDKLAAMSLKDKRGDESQNEESSSTSLVSNSQAKLKKFTAHSLPRSDDRRVALQMLLLFILRKHVPLKYRTTDSFLEAYPTLSERPRAEQEKLCTTANWFDLALLTLKPENNKSFLISVIPRMAEGAKARYITGSGESCQTRDRVFIFRKEGNCEPVKRAPRNRPSFGYSSSQRASKSRKTAGKDAQVLQSVFELGRIEMEETGRGRGGTGASLLEKHGYPSDQNEVAYHQNDTPPIGTSGLQALTESALSDSAHVQYFNGLGIPPQQLEDWITPPLLPPLDPPLDPPPVLDPPLAPPPAPTSTHPTTDTVIVGRSGSTDSPSTNVVSGGGSISGASVTSANTVGVSQQLVPVGINGDINGSNESFLTDKSLVNAGMGAAGGAKDDPLGSLLSRGKVGSKYGGIFKKMSLGGAGSQTSS